MFLHPMYVLNLFQKLPELSDSAKYVCISAKRGTRDVSTTISYRSTVFARSRCGETYALRETFSLKNFHFSSRRERVFQKTIRLRLRQRPHTILSGDNKSSLEARYYGVFNLKRQKAQTWGSYYAFPRD